MGLGKTGVSKKWKKFMDDNTRSSLNCMAAFRMNRMPVERRDEKWIADQLKRRDTRFIPVWQSKNLLSHDALPRSVMLSNRRLGGLLDKSETIILLGKEKGRVYFAIALPSDDPSMPANFATLGRFRELRDTAAWLPPKDAALLAYSRAILYWHHHKRFCGSCGSPTRSVECGHMRICTSEQCRQEHFPRTDPAIIVLVTWGEYCLLARQPSWPKAFYSTIAGFVEPGESLENAVVREVLEETGIHLRGVHYHSSQPWPFPSSIMLGFTAEAATRDIKLGRDELEDAAWFTREDIRHASRTGKLKLPTRVSIASRLIEDWFRSDGSGGLEFVMSYEL